MNQIENPYEALKKKAAIVDAEIKEIEKTMEVDCVGARNYEEWEDISFPKNQDKCMKLRKELHAKREEFNGLLKELDDMRPFFEHK